MSESVTGDTAAIWCETCRLAPIEEWQRKLRQTAGPRAPALWALSRPTSTDPAGRTRRSDPLEPRRESV